MDAVAPIEENILWGGDGTANNPYSLLPYQKPTNREEIHVAYS